MAQAGRYLIPATLHSWAVAAFADPNYGDLDIPENPGSLHVRAGTLSSVRILISSMQRLA